MEEAIWSPSNTWLHLKNGLFDSVHTVSVFPMTGQQFQELQDALCIAFTHETLDRMLRIRLEKDRATIVNTADLRTVAFNLIQVAEREGWVPRLVVEACKDNPGNLALRQFCQKYPAFLTVSTLQPNRSNSETSSTASGTSEPNPYAPYNDAELLVLRARISATLKDVDDTIINLPAAEIPVSRLNQRRDFRKMIDLIDREMSGRKNSD